jgi:hypothetical protein
VCLKPLSHLSDRFSTSAQPNGYPPVDVYFSRICARGKLIRRSRKDGCRALPSRRATGQTSKPREKPETAIGITEITLDHLRPSPDWKKQMDELQLTKDCEQEIQQEILKRLKLLAKRKNAAGERQRMLAEVFDLFCRDPPKPTSPEICARRGSSG